MPLDTNDVSLIFEKPSSLICNVLANELKTDEKIKVNVPDLSVFSEIAGENENAECKWKSTISKNKYYKSPVQQETFFPTIASKKQYDNKVQCPCLKNQYLHKSNCFPSKCELSNGLPLQNQGYFESESFHNGTKCNKQMVDNVTFKNCNPDLLEKKDYFTFSNDIFEHLRQQDKKLDDLQNQISLFLQHKDFPCQAQNILENEKGSMHDYKALDSDSSKKSSELNGPNADGLDYKFILMYIKEHSDQICKLQDQIDLLLKKTEKLESFYSRTNKLDQFDVLLKRIEKLESLNTMKDGCSDDRVTCSSKSNYQIPPIGDTGFILDNQSSEPDQDELMCHEEKKVKKTSTSTMTSLTFEGNDKLVFRKMLTVVTDVSNCQKDVSVQCTQGIDRTVTETRAKSVKTGSDSPNNERQVSSKSVDSKKQKRKSIKSPKKSANRSRKSIREQVCQKTPEMFSLPNACSSATLPKFRASNPDYVSSDSDRENRMVNDILSPKEKILFEISKNINQHIGTQGSEDLYPPMRNTNDPPKSVLKRHRDCKTKNTPPPILLSAERNKDYKSSSRSSSASSNTSADTVYASPHQQDKLDYNTIYTTRDSSVISKYGISSPNLSLATKLYLDKFGLVHQSEPSSPENKTEREFPRKHRNSDCRRQLR